MTSYRNATATAQPNIALIKYWGKVDELLILPTTGSLSMTLDSYSTTTTVTLRPELDQDRFILNGVPVEDAKSSRVSQFLERVRKQVPQGVDSSIFAEVRSENTVPTAAGLASSASGFAALSVAASEAYGLTLDKRQLSILARQGSGSASRSIFGGFVIWHAGSHEESFAEPIPETELDLGMTIVEISRAEKSISSREAMNIVQKTSPTYLQWTKHNQRMLHEMLQAITHNNFSTVGRLTEASSAGMHQTMKMATPEIWYPTDESLEIVNLVSEMRRTGLECYSTMDAGPNVKILSQKNDLPAVYEYLHQYRNDLRIIQSGMGSGAKLVQSSTPQE